jgi:hypothetical protein
MHAIVSSTAGERVKLILVKHPAECRDDGDTIRESVREVTDNGQQRDVVVVCRFHPSLPFLSTSPLNTVSDIPLAGFE